MFSMDSKYVLTRELVESKCKIKRRLPLMGNPANRIRPRPEFRFVFRKNKSNNTDVFSDM